jgi:hypothetical protein
MSLLSCFEAGRFFRKLTTSMLDWRRSFFRASGEWVGTKKEGREGEKKGREGREEREGEEGGRLTSVR